MTKKNRLFVLETNYWGHTVSKKKLEKEKSYKHNLRRVDTFKKFFTVKKFRSMGANLAKTFNLSIKIAKIREASSKMTKDERKKFFKKKSLQKSKNKKNGSKSSGVNEPVTQG